jgi:TolB-like protein
VVVAQSSVYQSIAELRKALGDDSEHPSYIATVPRKGYRLLAAVEPIAAPGHATVPQATGADVSAAKPGLGDARSPAPPSATLPTTAEPATAMPLSASGRPASQWKRRAWMGASGAGGLLLAVSTASWWRPDRKDTTRPVRLVVLPFEDRSDPPENALATGMTDELQAALERVRGLQVMARASSMRLVAQGRHATAIGQQLAASHLVRGSVRHDAARIEVAVELSALDSGAVVSTGRFQRAEAQAGAVADDILRALLPALNIKFETLRPAAPATRNFAALEAYFAGTQHLRKATPESIRTARDNFKRATEYDPDFANAWAGLALGWMAAHDFEGMPLRAAIGTAQPLAEKALALDPGSAVAHAVQGYVFLSGLRLQDADEHLQRAEELRPNLASAVFWRAMVAAFDGRPLDAVPIYLKAGQLDPMNFLVELLLGQA